MLFPTQEERLPLDDIDPDDGVDDGFPPDLPRRVPKVVVIGDFGFEFEFESP